MPIAYMETFRASMSSCVLYFLRYAHKISLKFHHFLQGEKGKIALFSKGNSTSKWINFKSHSLSKASFLGITQAVLRLSRVSSEWSKSMEGSRQRSQMMPSAGPWRFLCHGFSAQCLQRCWVRAWRWWRISSPSLGLKSYHHQEYWLHHFGTRLFPFNFPLSFCLCHNWNNFTWNNLPSWVFQ